MHMVDQEVLAVVVQVALEQGLDFQLLLAIPM